MPLALIGKSHLQHGMSRNSVVEVDRAPTVDHGYPDGWDSLEHFEEYDTGVPEWPDDFYGFGHVELAIDHGARVTGHHLHWALDKGARYEDLVIPMSDESPYRRRSDRWWQVYAQRQWVAPCGATDHELLKECLAANYGTIEFIDDGVGRIMASIEALGQTEDTIVVFTSDHGDMMGDHGLMLKGFMPFSGTMRVPMVIADPRQAADRSTSLASSIDLGPTLMDLCEVPLHDGIQGASLTPVLSDATASVRDHVLVEDDIRAAFAAHARLPSRIRTVISDDGLKYTRFSSGESMLFDLTADAHELDEIGHRDAAAHSRAESRLVDALLAATDDARGAPVASVVD
jgi:hypothetical protein